MDLGFPYMTSSGLPDEKQYEHFYSRIRSLCSDQLYKLNQSILGIGQ